MRDAQPVSHPGDRRKDQKLCEAPNPNPFLVHEGEERVVVTMVVCEMCESFCIFAALKDGVKTLAETPQKRRARKAGSLEKRQGIERQGFHVQRLRVRMGKWTRQSG